MTTRSQARQTRSGTIIDSRPPPPALGKRKCNRDTDRRSKRHASDAEVDANEVLVAGAAPFANNNYAGDNHASNNNASNNNADDPHAMLKAAEDENNVLAKFVGDLAEIIEEKDARIDNLQNALTDAQAQNGQLQDKNGQLRATLHDFAQGRTELKGQLEYYVEGFNTANKKLDTANKSLTDARANLQGSMSCRAKLQTTLEETNTRLEAANARADALQARIDAGSSVATSPSPAPEGKQQQQQQDAQPPVWGRLVGNGGFPASSELTKACTTIGRSCGANPCSHETPDIDVQNQKVSRMHLTVQKVAGGLCIVHTGNNRPLVTHKDGTAESVRPLVPTVIPLTSTVFITCPKAIPGTRMADMASAPSFRFVEA